MRRLRSPGRHANSFRCGPAMGPGHEAMKLGQGMHFRRILLLALALLAAAAAAPALAQQDLQALSQDPKQWPMAPRDYANTRYSALDQINAQNVSQLTLAW